MKSGRSFSSIVTAVSTGSWARPACGRLFAVCEEGLPYDGFDFGLETPPEAHERALRLIARPRSRFGPTEMKVAVVAHGTFNAFFLMAMMGRPWQRGA